MKLQIPDIVREDIQKWWQTKNPFKYRSDSWGYTLGGEKDLWQLPFEMQVGVLIAYCDSKGVIISITEQGYIITQHLKVKPKHAPEFRLFTNDKSMTRQEAQISALNEAFKLIEKEL